MKRLYFLSPDVETTRRAVSALRHAGIGDPNLMVIARHDVPLEDLPPAGVDRTDALPGLARGLAAGGALGALAGLVVLTFEDLGFALGGGAIALFALLGASVSGLMTLLGGASVPSSHLQKFHIAIEKDGKVLLMVDVRDERVEGIKTLVSNDSPTTEFVGIESGAPLVPP